MIKSSNSLWLYFIYLLVDTLKNKPPKIHQDKNAIQDGAFKKAGIPGMIRRETNMPENIIPNNDTTLLSLDTPSDFMNL